MLSAHRFGTQKRSLAVSAKAGRDGSSTGIAARAIRRTRKKAGLSRPQGRAATFGRDGSDRTAASAELNVSRETLCSGIGAAHSGLVAAHCDPGPSSISPAPVIWSGDRSLDVPQAYASLWSRMRHGPFDARPIAIEGGGRQAEIQ